MNIVLRALRKAVLITLGRERVENFIKLIAKYFSIDILVVAYQENGILNYETQVLSGEHFVISQVLPRLLKGITSPVIFDVGSNVGEVSIDLRNTFPSARIWAFEPNPVTFDQLSKNVFGQDVSCQNIGLGSEATEGKLYCYSTNKQSGHASMYRDVFQLYQNYGIKESSDLTEFSFLVSTVDAFCAQHSIAHIDFLKIDVEGNELSVLKGAMQLITANQVPVIQFEFTDCNVMSKTFFRDFYQLLPHYQFYRLKQSGLLPLGKYQARHEIFQFQNVLAVHNDLADQVKDLTAK